MKARFLLLLPLLLACHREPAATSVAPPAAASGAEHGKQLAARYGCNVCHVMPGVSGAQGALGPSLAGVASRPMLSNGTFANTPENVARFIQQPGSMNPASSMPPLAVTPADARDLAAYLMTLK